jgi:hypothetical protein
MPSSLPYLIRTVGEVHACNVQTSCALSVTVLPIIMVVPTLTKHCDLLWRVGLRAYSLLALVGAAVPTSCSLTNGANDAGSAVDLLWDIVGLQRSLPLQLGPIVEVCESVRHSDGLMERFVSRNRILGGCGIQLSNTARQ